jgi:iron complex outermembrane receptor protein
LLLCAAAGTARAQSVEELRNLSIEDLANVQITSVSKTSEKLSDAAAAIFVISHDDIIRSGASTIPEMLRLAPNLQVAQLNATTYAISARGFNVGNNASMSDKLLVLIDGRTVYTPLFAGVYWDMQGVLPDNIERIEVISGPGGTLYGANAVNGVINIITRSSAATQGGLLEVGAGNLQRSGSLQYGGRINDALTYRVYGTGAQYSPNKLANGSDAEDAWSKPQGGFRIDWTPARDSVTLQGDLFQASEDPGNSISGRDLVALWQHQLDGGSSVQTQAYWDQAKRLTDNGGGGFVVNTYDFSVQHSFALNDWNNVIWGAGDRVISYDIENTATLLFQPAGRTLNLANIFAQDTLALTPTVKLTLGMKLENEPFTGLEPLPQARLSWKVTDSALLWTAVSRAVRAPTPVDRDIVERIGTTDIISHSFNFQPETLTSYELGSRVQLTPRASFSVSTFYNVYDDLRTLEPTPGGTVFPGIGALPLRWSNQMEGLVYGLEVWGDYRATDWWRLSAGFNLQHEHLRFKAGSSGVGGLPLAADDPNHQASLRSSVDLGHGVSWDTFLRYVGKLPNPAVPEYVELDTRIGWKITPALDISISGFNLIHAHHPEFAEPGITDEVARSFFVQTRWRF